MSTKYQRPAGVYAGASGLANRSKYQDDASATPKRAISSGKVDGDVNYVVDALNELDQALLDASLSGTVPGQSGNAGKVLTTNGTTLSWGDALSDDAVTLAKMAHGTADTLLGYGSGGVPSAVTAGSNVTISSGVISVAIPAAVPSGVLAPFAGASAPTGWLLCDGSAVSRTTYAGLFSAIGSAFGAGDGSTTFNVPDLRGRSVFGLDNMGGTDAGRLSVTNTLGGTGGAEKKTASTDGHTLTLTEIPAHTHGMQGTSGGTNGATSAQPSPVSGSGLQTASAGGGAAHSHGITNFDVMPPYVLMNYIIKV